MTIIKHKTANHSQRADSAINTKISKRTKRRNRKQDFTPTKVSSKEVEISNRQTRCWRCGSTSLAFAVARVSGVLRQTGWMFPLACFQYIKCANCDTIQDKELNKALLKGGVR